MHENSLQKILLVDDEIAHIEFIRRAFSSHAEPFEIIVAKTIQDARDYLVSTPPDLAIIDLNLPDGTGTELLPVAQENMRCPAIIMTARGNEQAAVEAIKAGALDYVVKSISSFAELPRIAERALREWIHIQTRRQAEIGLRQSEEKFRSVVESAPNVIITTDLDGTITFINHPDPGYTHADLIGSNIYDFVHSDHVSRVREIFNRVIKLGIQDSCEHPGSAGKPRRFYALRVGPLRRDNRIVGLSIVRADITGRLRMEEQLTESTERFRKLVENAPIGIFVIQNERFVYANPAMLNMLGAESERDLEGRNPIDSVHPDSLPLVEEWQAMMRRGESPEPIYHKIVRLDGKILEVDGAPNQITYNGRPAIQVIIHDVTERRRVEEAFRESEERFRMAFENAPIGVTLISPEGRFMQVNAEFTRIVGYSREELLEMNVSTLTHEDDRENTTALIKTLLNGVNRKTRFEKRYLHKNGNIVWAQINAQLQRNLLGVPEFFITQVVDITDRKFAEEEREKLEAQLRRSQKLETIGTLAGGIAHDFNNILTPILGYTDIVLAEIDEGSPVREDLEHVIAAASRAKDLVKQILAFSRQGEQERRPVEIQLIIKEALKLLRASLPSTIEIKQEISQNGCGVLADPSQVHQVLMNLCTNAFHAMRDSGGVLEVKLDSVDIDETSETKQSTLITGKYVCLTVSDTGTGMDKATLDRIFEPFFTTKAVGDGTGLGLSVVHGIVLHHGGDIVVHSEPGKGTTFKVYFPQIESEMQAAVHAETTDLHGSGHILYVDDDRDIAEMGHRMLERYGYRVTAFTNSREALSVFRSQPNDFDLIVTDQTMPELTGMDLCREVFKVRADIPIVLTTGFSESVTAESIQELGLKEFVMKPLITRDFLAAVKRALMHSVQAER